MLPTDLAIFSSPIWSIPLCIQICASSWPRPASVCAASFSWWGKTRSLPPPWISNGAPSTSRPSRSTRCASPGGRGPTASPTPCPPSASSPSRARSRAGPPCARRPRALTLVHVVHVAVREGAVLGQRAHAEVDVALGLVGMAALDQRLDQLDDLRHHLRRLGLEVRAPEPEAPGVLEVGRRHLRGELVRGPARRARRIVDLVVDVGDVGGQHRVVALVAQEALEQREEDERPRVADVDAPIDRRPAGVDADAVAGTRDAAA